jgi:hypothetical protein
MLVERHINKKISEQKQAIVLYIFATKPVYGIENCLALKRIEPE